MDKGRGRREVGKEGRDRRGIWDVEGRKILKRKMEEIRDKKRGLGEVLKEVRKKVRETMEEAEKSREGGNKGTRRCWDEECKERKREVRKELREWRRKGGKEGEIYRKKKREYNELCRRKKEEENKRWARKAMEVRRKDEVWEIVNRERRERRKVNKGIKIDEWREYFMTEYFMKGTGKRA